MVKLISKYDYPDLAAPIDLQTGTVCRIWL